MLYERRDCSHARCMPLRFKGRTLNYLVHFVFYRRTALCNSKYAIVVCYRWLHGHLHECKRKRCHVQVMKQLITKDGLQIYHGEPVEDALDEDKLIAAHPSVAIGWFPPVAYPATETRFMRIHFI